MVNIFTTIIRMKINDYEWKEFKQFLNIGLGSLAELETQVLISGELKVKLFVERQCMKYCKMEVQAVGAGDIVGRSVRHVMDPNMDNGGNHDENDAHWYEHGGNHLHNRGVTMRWDGENDRYEIHSLPIEDLPKDKRESFMRDLDDAIKTTIAKYATGEPEPVVKKVDNPPEPRRIIIVNSEEEKRRIDEERKRSLEEIGRSISAQISEVTKRVIPGVVKEEFDKLRGKVK